jgi:hypothetical protein
VRNLIAGLACTTVPLGVMIAAVCWGLYVLESTRLNPAPLMAVGSAITVFVAGFIFCLGASVIAAVGRRVIHRCPCCVRPRGRQVR